MPAGSGTKTLQLQVRHDTNGGAENAFSILGSYKSNRRVTRQRSAEIVPGAFVIAAVDESDKLVWPATVADPTVERLEYADPDGTLHGRTVQRAAATINLAITDDPAIRALRVFATAHSDPDGLSPLATVAVPPSDPAAAPTNAAGSVADNRVDIAILGDGYTASEQLKLASDAGAAFNGLLNEPPFSEYSTYFSLRTVPAVSAQSGADHPEAQPATFVDTAFDAQFGCAGIDRLLCVDTTKVEAALTGLSATERDIVLVLVNDPTYGGSGGLIAVASAAADALELVRHEIGHSFGLLADEYDYGTCNLFVDPYPNVTDATVRANVKWNAWIDGSTPVPTTTSDPAVPGVYEGGNYCTTGVYRPTYDSKMRTLYRPFDQINSEQLVKRIYNFVSPIDGIDPAPGTVTVDTSQAFRVTTLQPRSHALAIEWRLDGSLVSTAASYTASPLKFGVGSHTL